MPGTVARNQVALGHQRGSLKDQGYGQGTRRSIVISATAAVPGEFRGADARGSQS